MRRGAAKLMVGISNHQLDPNTWCVVALETPEKNVDAILDNHGHQYLGEFDDLKEAQGVAEVFAQEWANKRDEMARCACKPIRRRSRSAKTSGVAN